MEKCNKCGNENTEVAVFDFKAIDLKGKIAEAATIGTLEIQICQSCVSGMFRNFDKDK